MYLENKTAFDDGVPLKFMVLTRGVKLANMSSLDGLEELLFPSLPSNINLASFLGFEL